MNENELLPGNWVRVDSIREKYGMVTENYHTVDSAPGIRMISVSGKGTGARYCVRLSETQPILISPKLLEMNGFVEDGEGYMYFTDQYHIIIDCSASGKLTIDIKNDLEKTMYRREDVNDYYLHSLQNALSLCEIKKKLMPYE